MFSSWTATEQWRERTVPCQEESCRTLAQLSFHVTWRTDWLKAGTLEPHVLALWLRTRYLPFLSFSVRISKMGMIKWARPYETVGSDKCWEQSDGCHCGDGLGRLSPSLYFILNTSGCRGYLDGAVAVVTTWVVGWGSETVKPGFAAAEHLQWQAQSLSLRYQAFHVFYIYISVAEYISKDTSNKSGLLIFIIWSE